MRKGSVGVTYSEGCSAEDRQLVSTMFSRFIIIIHQQYAHFCHKKQPKHFIPVWRVAQKSPKNFKMLLRPWRALVRPIYIRFTGPVHILMMIVLVMAAEVQVFQRWHFVKKNCNASTIPSILQFWSILTFFDQVVWPSRLVLGKNSFGYGLYMPWRGLYWHCNFFYWQSVTFETP